MARTFQTAHLPSYAQINFGANHAFHLPGTKPLTIRVDVINLFDRISGTSRRTRASFQTVANRGSYETLATAFDVGRELNLVN